MKENAKLYKFLKIICNALIKILYNPIIIGKENIPSEGPLIFVSNHKHAFDPVLIMTNTERIVHYMAKESLFKGLHGKILEKLGIIKVYRTKKNPVAVKEAIEILNNNGTVGIFPEGTRNRTNDELLKFRHGAVAIAKQANTKIMPVAIKGKYKLFRKSICVEFGNCVDISNMEIESANDYIKNEVLKLLRK